MIGGVGVSGTGLILTRVANWAGAIKVPIQEVNMLGVPLTSRGWLGGSDFEIPGWKMDSTK